VHTNLKYSCQLLNTVELCWEGSKCNKTIGAESWRVRVSLAICTSSPGTWIYLITYINKIIDKCYIQGRNQDFAKGEGGLKTENVCDVILILKLPAPFNLTV